MSRSSASQKKTKTKKGSNRKSGSSRWYDHSHFIFLGIASLVFIVARLQLLSIPLERDEGGFAYVSHWMWRGLDLYTDLPDSKLPGLYGIYGLITSLFGYHAVGIHIGLLVSNIAAAFAFYYLVRSLFNNYIAAIATGFLLILITGPNVVGFAAHATQLLLPFVLGGCLLFWKGIHERKGFHFFLAGLMIGIAFTIKQQAALYGILLAILWWPVRLWWDHPRQKIKISEWLFLGIGGLLPLVLMIMYYAAVQRLDDFMYWTYDQPMRLAQSFIRPWHELFWDGFRQVVRGYELLWVTGLAGIVLLFFIGQRKETRWFGILFILTGLLSIAIGVGYYRHYFVPAMPGLALCLAVVAYWVVLKTNKKGPWIGAAFSLGLLCFPLALTSGYFFYPDHDRIHQEAYNMNMFPELEKIGQELSRRVPEGSKIAVLGSEPEVLVAAQRQGCSKQFMLYSLFINPESAQKMQDEYFNDITTCNADYLVFDIFSSSWVPGFENLPLHKNLLEWMNANYFLEGLAEFRDGEPGLILWGDAARSHKEETTYVVYVMKKQ